MGWRRWEMTESVTPPPLAARASNLLPALAAALEERVEEAMVGAIGQPPTAIAALLAAQHAPGQNIQDLRRTIGLSHAASVRSSTRWSTRNSSSDCRPVTMVARLRSTQPKQDAKQPCARSLPADE